ncbi:MAG: YitT family protein [Bacteroidales bacterium]|nr:YitT family protein [Bacteroidales bacterium]
MDRKKVFGQIRDFFWLTLACFIFAFAWEGFMIPNGLSAGGMMGLCTVLQYATAGVIKAQYSYIVVNGLLIIIAVWAMGIGFGFKTIYSIAVSSLAMQLLGSMDFLHCLPGQFFYVRETLLIPVIAGVLEGVGIGMVIRYGGSTGGTDIVALMINKFWPVSLSKAFLIMDFFIIALILFLPGKTFADMIYGIVEIVLFSTVLDFVVAGQKSSYQLLVFSDHYQKIADHIINDLERGVTVLKAQGWYTKMDKNVLLILISKKELTNLMKEIKKTDPRAFMSVSPTSSVYGEGFEEIKAGITNNRKSE